MESICTHDNINHKCLYLLLSHSNTSIAFYPAPTHTHTHTASGLSAGLEHTEHDLQQLMYSFLGQWVMFRQFLLIKIDERTCQ